MKTFLATFAAILCAAAVIWTVWSAKTARETSRAIQEQSFADTAAHAERMRMLQLGDDSWHPEMIKPEDPFAGVAEWVDVLSARGTLERLKGVTERSWSIQNSVRDYLRHQRGFVDDHKKYFPAWASEMTKTLDAIEAEAGKK